METRLELCLKTLETAVPLDETRMILTVKELTQVSTQIKLLQEAIQREQERDSNDDDDDDDDDHDDPRDRSASDDDEVIPPPTKRGRFRPPQISDDKLSASAKTLRVSPPLRKLLSYLNHLPSCYLKGDTSLPSNFDVLQGNPFHFYGLHSAQCKTDPYHTLF